MKNKSKLAFDLLELEMEVFSKEEQRGVLGGYVNSTGYDPNGGDTNYYDPNGYDSTGYYTSNSSSSTTDCVFQCMTQIAAFYGDFSFTSNSLANTYDSIYAGMISNGTIGSAVDGVDAGLISHFVDQYFNRSAVSNLGELDSLLNQGGDNWVIGSYLIYGANGYSLHAIVITGISDDGTQYKYSDPQNAGSTSFVDKNCIETATVITGLCN